MSILYIRNSDGKFIELPTIPGKSAYEIAVEKGVFSGTEEEFAQAQIFENKEILNSITQERIDSWDNGGQIDLSEYATEKYVDDAIKEIDVTDQLEDYAKKEYVDNNITINVLPVTNPNVTGATVIINDIPCSGVYALPKRTDGQAWSNLRLQVKGNDGSLYTAMLSGYQNSIFNVKLEDKKILIDDLKLTYIIGDTKDTSSITTEAYYLPTSNTKIYTPTSDYHPSTKKYVDDSIANIPNYDDTELRELINNKADEEHEHDQYLTEHQPLDDYATKDELHFHENKEILDNITQMDVDSWNRELVLRYDEETMDLYIGFERFSGTTGVTYVEYIESTGTQYIDTGLFANYNWRYEMVLQNDSFNQYENFFGTNSSNHRVLMGNNNSNVIYCYGADTTYPWTFTDKKITIYADKNRLFIDNMLIGESSANPSTTPFNQTLLVFQGRYTSALDKYGIFKCYSFKVWDENDNLILHYKPCLDPSNIPCMYDEVSKTYVYNSASGQFLYGKKLT